MTNREIQICAAVPRAVSPGALLDRSRHRVRLRLAEYRRLAQTRRRCLYLVFVDGLLILPED